MILVLSNANHVVFTEHLRGRFQIRPATTPSAPWTGSLGRGSNDRRKGPPSTASHDGTSRRSYEGPAATAEATND